MVEGKNTRTIIQKDIREMIFVHHKIDIGVPIQVTMEDRSIFGQFKPCRFGAATNPIINPNFLTGIGGRR